MKKLLRYYICYLITIVSMILIFLLIIVAFFIKQFTLMFLLIILFLMCVGAGIILIKIRPSRDTIIKALEEAEKKALNKNINKCFDTYKNQIIESSEQLEILNVTQKNNLEMLINDNDNEEDV